MSGSDAIEDVGIKGPSTTSLLLALKQGPAEATIVGLAGYKHGGCRDPPGVAFG
jgi:hypothetical protein